MKVGGQINRNKNPLLVVYVQELALTNSGVGTKFLMEDQGKHSIVYLEKLL